MKIPLTGCAGFIGSHVLDRLLDDGRDVVGVDNFDPFYARGLKNANVEPHIENSKFDLIEGDLADLVTYQKISFQCGTEKPEAIIHLAAKAWVHPSIEDPVGYQRAGVLTTQNLLEFAKDQGIQQFVQWQFQQTAF